ncbi:hypothetical protein JO380_000522 [Cellulomonas iranensis]|uniref:Uncharacterized protein n=1 Tax=Cellulomonas iranensis TaxID=76862 RepID=A0ABU0GFL5_9CELL|nr:hypothetical protein [Cellulomonas iranensis]
MRRGTPRRTARTGRLFRMMDRLPHAGGVCDDHPVTRFTLIIA